MLNKNGEFSKTKFWLFVIALVACGVFVGIGIANWGHAVEKKHGLNQTQELTAAEVLQDQELVVAEPCQAVEKVLVQRLSNNEDDCDLVKSDLDTLQKLIRHGCFENQDNFEQMVINKQAVFDVMCNGNTNSNEEDDLRNVKTTCGKIEESLIARLPWVDASASADRHIDRAKIYAMMSEKGCPENNQKYIDLAKQELDIARAIQDDRFDEGDTIEVVETYKRLKMQQDAEEIFNKAKKLTNPAIDFIMQVEKIINE